MDSQHASHDGDRRGFEGQTALVVGAGSGIGRRVAQDLALRGARVGLVGRTKEKLQTVEGEISAAGGEALSVPADVRDLATMVDAVRAVEARFGPVDLGVQCAATGAGQRFLCDQDEESWLTTIDTNLNGAFRFCRSLVPGMMDRGRGSLVLMSSVAGKRGVPANTAYCASKFGINGLTKALATEVGRFGVRVNNVCPGLTDTEMVRDEDLYGRDFMDSVRKHFGPDNLTWERFWKSTVRATNMGRLVDTDEVSDMTLFLLSGSARSISGESFSVDGGSP